MTIAPYNDIELPTYETNDRATVYKLANDRMFAVPHVPHHVEVPRTAVMVRKALGALSTLENVKRRVGSDATLSELGRAESVKADVATARNIVAEAQADLVRFTQDVSALESRVYAPPSLAETDTASAIMDMEMRNYVRSLKGAERAKAVGEMANEPRLLAAVVRSPMNLAEFTAHGADLWRQHVAATHPQANLVQQQKEALAWASDMLPRFAAAVG